MAINGKAVGPIVDPPAWKDRRQHRRKPVIWAARLETGQGTVPCSAFDVSLSGAKLRLDEPVALHEPVRLVLDHHGVIAAEAVWRRGRTLGLRFTEPADYVRAILGDTLTL